MAELRSVKGGGQPEPPRNAKEALHQVQDEYLECRDLRHAWRSLGAFYVGREVHRKVVCTRCETEAVDKWTGKGGRIARQYHYAKGYTVKAVRIKPLDVRQEVLSRIEVFKNEDDMLANLMQAGRRKRA